jgi:hypothetical protein
MADKFQTVHTVKFYEFISTSFIIRVVNNLSWKSYYVSIQRNAPNVDKNGEDKQSCHSVYLTRASVLELFKHLEPALRFVQTHTAHEKTVRIF